MKVHLGERVAKGEALLVIDSADLAQAYDCAHLFIAIDIAHFCDPQWFRREAAAAAARIRSGRRAAGVDHLFTPGEPEWLARRRAGGRVTLEPTVIAMLERFARELGVRNSLFEEPTKEERHA